MAPTEAARSQLYNKLTEVLGAESAETLMRSLPPTPISELATKGDIALVKSDLTALRSDLTALRSDLTALKADLGAVKTDLKADIARLDESLADLNQRIDRIFIAQGLGFATVIAAVFASHALL